MAGIGEAGEERAKVERGEDGSMLYKTVAHSLESLSDAVLMRGMTLFSDKTREEEDEGEEAEMLRQLVRRQTEEGVPVSGSEDDSSEDEDSHFLRPHKRVVSEGGGDGAGAMTSDEEEIVERIQTIRRKQDRVYEHQSQQERFEAKMRQWEHKLERFPILNEWERQTGIHKVHIVMFMASLVVVVIFMGWGFEMLAAFVAFAFPVYATYKTIEYPRPARVRAWLSYWVVIAAYCTFDPFITPLMQWVPFYNAIKLCFLFWCFLPRFMGATVVYERGVRPLLSMVQDSVDEAGSTVAEATVMAATHIRNHSALSAISGLSGRSESGSGRSESVSRSGKGDVLEVPKPEVVEEEEEEVVVKEGEEEEKPKRRKSVMARMKGLFKRKKKSKKDKKKAQ